MPAPGGDTLIALGPPDQGGLSVRPAGSAPQFGSLARVAGRFASPRERNGKIVHDMFNSKLYHIDIKLLFCLGRAAEDRPR
jgi:hypothetical protein